MNLNLELHPLRVGKRMVNLSEGVTSAPAGALPVLVFIDEFQAMMAQPVEHISTHSQPEVIL